MVVSGGEFLLSLYFFLCFSVLFDFYTWICIFFIIRTIPYCHFSLKRKTGRTEYCSGRCFLGVCSHKEQLSALCLYMYTVFLRRPGGSCVSFQGSRGEVGKLLTILEPRPCHVQLSHYLVKSAIWTDSSTLKAPLQIPLCSQG